MRVRGARGPGEDGVPDPRSGGRSGPRLCGPASGEFGNSDPPTPFKSHRRFKGRKAFDGYIRNSSLTGTRTRGVLFPPGSHLPIPRDHRKPWDPPMTPSQDGLRSLAHPSRTRGVVHRGPSARSSRSFNLVTWRTRTNGPRQQQRWQADHGSTTACSPPTTSQAAACTRLGGRRPHLGRARRALTGSASTATSAATRTCLAASGRSSDTGRVPRRPVWGRAGQRDPPPRPP